MNRSANGNSENEGNFFDAIRTSQSAERVLLICVVSGWGKNIGLKSKNIYIGSVLLAVFISLSLYCGHARAEQNQTTPETPRSSVNLINYSPVITETTSGVQLRASDYFRLAYDYKVNGEIEKSLEMANQGLQLDPGYIWGYRFRSELYRLFGDYETAFADYTYYLEHTDKIEAIDYFNLAYLYMCDGDFEKSLETTSQGLLLDPEYAWGYMFRSYLYDLLGDSENAILDYAHFIQFADQVKSGNYFNLAYMYVKNGEYEKSLTMTQQGLLRDPGNTWACGFIVNLHYRLMDYENAIRDYSNCLDTVKDRGFSSFLMGYRAWTYYEMGEYEKSYADYTQAIVLSTTGNYALYYGRGCASLKLNNFQDAYQDFDVALSLKPGVDYPAYLNHGYASLRVGRINTALNDLWKSVNLFMGGLFVTK